MSRKVELFLAVKRVLRSPGGDKLTDEEISERIGARLIEAQEIITEARKDHDADSMS